MEALLLSIFDVYVHGGIAAILTLLLGFIGFLIYDRYQLIKEHSSLREDHEKSVLGLLDRYHSGQALLIDALNELRIILAVIKEKV